MNKVILMGRITKDLEMQNKNGTNVLRFTLAVDRRFKKDVTDFISCVAFSKTAEFITKYFHKGSMLACSGSIQTGSYDKNGSKVYTTDVIVDDAYFTSSKAEANGTTETRIADSDATEGFLLGGDEGDLPF